GASLAMLDIPPLNVSGGMTIGPAPSETSSLTHFWFDLNVAAKHARTYQAHGASVSSPLSVGVDCIAVLFPQFTKLLPTSAKDTVPLYHGLGEVEQTLTGGDLVRVHIGRGKVDKNQQAWL